MANALTLARVVLIFVIIAVWARDIHLELYWLDFLMVPLLAWAIFMDALDGWVARMRHEESEAGAFLDIAGDRIVELVLWVFFAIRRDASGVPFVPYWVPLVIVTRTVLTDSLRSIAARYGRTPFGERTMQESAWGRQLTSSRWSRASYGVLKAIAFCALGAVYAWHRLPMAVEMREAFRSATLVLVYATAAFSVLRAVPVLWDGRRYLAADTTGESG